MSLYLSENEVCPFGRNCPYNKNSSAYNSGCAGFDKNRKTKFICDLVNERGEFEDLKGKLVNSENKTGKMEIIHG